MMPNKTTKYIGNFVYEDEGSGDELKYILTTEGRIMIDGNAVGYRYNLKDHLGNTRVEMDQSGALTQATDYYPFGMRHNQTSMLSTENRYLYNGKELQEDTDWYDFGARFYDPSIGRWTTQDPLADFAPGISPYNYCLNNPVSFVDPDGLWPWDDPATKRKKKQKRVNKKREREQNREKRKRDRKKPKGKKYNPNFQRLGPTNRDLYTLIPNVPDDIEDISLELDVELPDMELINIRQSYLERLEEDLTGSPRNFTSSFGSKPGNHNSYISKGKGSFDTYARQIAELINQKPNIKVKVIVSTGYREHESLTHDGSPINIYTAPGVKIVGTSNRLLRARRDYIKGALKSAGVPSGNISTSYKFGQRNSVIIKVTK